MHNFLENEFIIIPSKGMEDLFDNMVERVYGRIHRCVTPFLDARFKCEDEQSTSNILTVNIVFSENLKKVSGVIVNRCFTLAIKF